MFEGFELRMVELPDATLRVRIGGAGPPIMLLHGHPRTHTTWHKVAPLLARDFTVICPDLRGFGKSSKPQDTIGHQGSSKRAKGRDCSALMRVLGFESFALVGHDRGAYTAFRAAMDHPNEITKLVILDAVPILEAFERCDAKFASMWWHWFFYLQANKPEQAILANPSAWYGGGPEAMGQENYEDFQTAIHDPATVHGMLEDYRAAYSIDQHHDAEDRCAGRRLMCPLLVLWSLHDDLEQIYGDVLDVWRPWATKLNGWGIDSGHHMAEEAPEKLAGILAHFLILKAQQNDLLMTAVGRCEFE